jgi:hypothetical protein
LGIVGRGRESKEGFPEGSQQSKQGCVSRNSPAPVPSGTRGFIKGIDGGVALGPGETNRNGQVG